ncbi:Disease resistance protein RGA2 [Bienertia sinuspersici]
MSGIGEGVVLESITNQVNGVIGMLLSLMKDEINLAWGFENELGMFKEEIGRLSCLLEGASGGTITNPWMKDWLKKIKDVAYDANILLDEWSYDVLDRKINLSTQPLDKLVNSVTYQLFCHKMGRQVRHLRNLISTLNKDADKLGIRLIEVAVGEVYNGNKHALEVRNKQMSLDERRQCVDHELMLGRNEDISHLVRLLCDPTNNNKPLTVVGVVGSAGLGKTALCKHVSNKEEVLNYFNSLVIWLAVSRNYDLKDILNRMVEILFKETSTMNDKEAIKSKLKEKLKGKKYLLILDDIWDTNFWEPLRLTLQDIGVSKGSTVLVTSCSRSVVENMETEYGGQGMRTICKPSIHALQDLNESDSWSLFKERLCEYNLANSEKEKIATKIINYCGGVPLAIRAIGDLLRDQSIERWREIEESDLWKKEDKYGILPSLMLSYDYLPHTNLKKCFSYCAIFEEDEVIEKNKLICMWMAHDLLQPYDEMELTGEEYFKILLDRSLFQEAKMDEIGNVKSIKMHDLVWYLARAVSMGECLHSYQELVDGSSDVRHLSLPYLISKFNFTCTKLQTLFLGSSVITSETIFQLKKFRHLRVLRINCNCKGISWSEILDGSFKHLRYLEIDGTLKMEDMRRLFSNVKSYHLQTLCIRSFYSSRESGDVCLIIRGIRNLVKLRHIHCRDFFGIPEGLGRLTALQTLPNIDLLEKWGGSISELGLLNNLRGTLIIHNLQCLTIEEDDALSIFSAEKLKHIQRLSLSWGTHMMDSSLVTSEQPYQNKVLDAIESHKNLKILKIKGYQGTTFPRWLTERGSTLDNLVSLQLEFCDYVKDLKIDKFKHLRFLVIQCCMQLRISFPDDGFQCCNLLEELTLYGCEAPFLPDLSPLTKLRVLCIVLDEKQIELVGLASLPNLRELKTTQSLPADLDKHSPLCKSLQKLTLQPLGNRETLPEQLQHLVTLRGLTMWWYNVEIIPEWLGNLTALRSLELDHMKKLQCLPSHQAMQRLSNLEALHVEECPLLIEDIRSNTGEWFKIAHIPLIEVNHLRIKHQIKLLPFPLIFYPSSCISLTMDGIALFADPRNSD